MGSRGLSASAQEGFMAAHAHAHASEAPVPENPDHGTPGHVHGRACKHDHGHSHSRNPIKLCAKLCNKMLPGTLLAIVGLDLYTKGKGAEGMARAAEKGGGGNPFDVGLMRNCTDFWTRGRTLGVDYQQIYDLPPEGYRSVIAQRRRNEGQAAAARKRGGGYEMLRSTNEDV